MKRVGIYAGTFDPVHAGHITFALQAAQTATLDQIYFLPERQPRGKHGVEHFGHRVAMLRRAARPHPKFEVLELPDINFSVRRTLNRLRQQFAGDELVFLMGSDIAAQLGGWPHVDQLLANTEVIVGLRDHDNQDDVKDAVADWPVAPRAVHIMQSLAPDISSHQVRAALYARQSARGLLRSVARYSDQNWVYIAVA